MPLYRATGAVAGSKYLGEFEAATPEEAEEMAENSAESWVSLCHQCSSQCEDPEIQSVFVEEIEAEPKPATKPKRKRNR